MTDRTPLATTGDLAAMLDAELVGPGDLPVCGVASLDDAIKGDLSFIRAPKYANRWARSAASSAVVTRGIEVPGHDASVRALLFVDDADRAMITMLHAAQERAPRDTPSPGVHPGAHIASGAVVPESASVGAGAVIGEGATIGEHAVIGAGAVLAPGVAVGAHTRLHPRVTMMIGTRIGAHAIVFPGAVIGADGFGFLPGPEGPIKVPHLGGVTIGDRVEIGANTTIDRGKFDDTTIGDNTKIDNQVQIAHACKIGRGVIICGCCAVGGSVTIGDGAVLAGHVSVRDNVSIAPGAIVGGNSAIDGDVDATEPWFGYPARPLSVASRNYTTLTKLGELWSTVRDLRKRVGAMEKTDP